MSKESASLAVLVIDDEPLIRWTLSEALFEARHAVVDAPDGAGGLRAVMTVPQAFDVVFLDFRLPDSNDFTLLTAIRTWAPRSAVVLMTASGTPEMVAEAYRLGVSEFSTSRLTSSKCTTWWLRCRPPQGPRR